MNCMESEHMGGGVTLKGKMGVKLLILDKAYVSNYVVVIIMHKKNH